MSQNNFKDEYPAFNRHILSEFMSEKELKEMDKKYTKAKIDRQLKRYEQVEENKKHFLQKMKERGIIK